MSDPDTLNAVMNMVTALAVAYASVQLKRIRSDLSAARDDLEASSIRSPSDRGRRGL